MHMWTLLAYHSWNGPIRQARNAEISVPFRHMGRSLPRAWDRAGVWQILAAVLRCRGVRARQTQDQPAAQRNSTPNSKSMGYVIGARTQWRLA